MGLLQKACETYDCHADLVGVPRVGFETLAPISHIAAAVQIEITVNQAGRFVSARAVDQSESKKDKSESKTIIPVTEQSGGRSGTNPLPHPLCDQLKYLAGYDTEKYEGYVAQLTQWAGSPYGHPKLRPILQYVKGGTILTDLAKSGVIRLDKEGHPKKENAMVCWRVVGLDSGEPAACGEDQSLFRAFIDYYRAKTGAREKKLCMITGTLSQPAIQHPKGIAPACGGNTKLISANDESGFTYRGRFTTDWQAATVGYEASQKAHNALRWLVANQGVSVGGRVFLCWNPQGKKTCSIIGPFRTDETPQITEPTEYREDLRKTLLGYRDLLPDSAGVVIAAFDAVTKGRLSLTYYNELMGSDFLQRIHDWDAVCCWRDQTGAIRSPSLSQVAECAFGKLEKGGPIIDKSCKKQIQRLVSCRVDRARFPRDIKDALVRRASNLAAYAPEARKNLEFTVCAVLKKYYFDRNGEEWSMALEPGKDDRSYQFGRLLAVMEKVERDTYAKEEKREPNAMRQQSIFCQRPMYTAANLEKQLEQAYFPRLTPGMRVFYKNMISQIMEEIYRTEKEQWNRPLSDTYLMGYYLQRGALYTKKAKQQVEEDET